MKRLFKTMLCIGIMYSSYSNFAVNAHVKEEIQENEEFNQLRLPVNHVIDFYTVDYTAPKINEASLKVDKQVVRPGEMVKISLEVTDDISGVDYVSITYQKPISKNMQSINLKYNYSTGLYEGSMYVDESTESGVWKIDYIYVSDNKNNTDWVYNVELNPYEPGRDLSQGNFKVEGTESTADYTAPKINEASLKVDKQAVRPGEVVKISLEVTDDISGVGYVDITYKKPISKNMQSINLKYNYSTGLYEGSMYVDESTESGVWKIDYIYVSDNKNNTDWVYNVELNPYEPGRDLSQGNFKVEGTESTADYTAPKINEASLKVDKQAVRPGEVVKISLEVTDDISGVGYVDITYKKPISKNMQSINLKYNYSTGLYEGSMYVDESTESGVWKIDYIYVSDNKNNTDWVYNVELNPYEPGRDLSQGNFIVTEFTGNGWKWIDGTWYYLNESGVMVTGWEKVDGTWYYFNKSGEMQIGWLKEGSTWYYLNASGAMVTGWEQIGGVWYYFDGSGVMQTGWLPSGSTWYYLSESGAMVTGWEQIGGVWYYFDGSGVMQTGWLLLGSTWYYLNESGAMVTGWEQIGGVWYYFYSNGVMATNTVIDGWQITSSGAAYQIK